MARVTVKTNTAQEVADGKVVDRRFADLRITGVPKGSHVEIDVVYDDQIVVYRWVDAGDDGVAEFSFPVIEAGEFTVRAFDRSALDNYLEHPGDRKEGEDQPARKSLGRATVGAE